MPWDKIVVYTSCIGIINLILKVQENFLLWKLKILRLFFGSTQIHYNYDVRCCLVLNLYLGYISSLSTTLGHLFNIRSSKRWTKNRHMIIFFFFTSPCSDMKTEWRSNILYLILTKQRLYDNSTLFFLYFNILSFYIFHDLTSFSFWFE